MTKRIFLAAALLSLSFAGAATAQTNYNVTLFSAPKSTGTFGCGIDSSGDVVGFYYLSNGYYIVAFKRAADGTFTTIIPPLKQTRQIVAGGINDSGSIIGTVEAAAFISENGSVAYFGDEKHPANGNGINNLGTYVGTLLEGAQHYVGYIQSAGNVRYIPPIGDDDGIFGINNSGTAVGYYLDEAGGHGFALTGTSTQTLDVPGANGTAAFGINDNGVIVGGWNVGSTDLPQYHCGEFGLETQGFVYTNGEFTTFNVPGALATAVYGINNSGQLAGTVYGPGTTMGFIATPQ